MLSLEIFSAMQSLLLLLLTDLSSIFPYITSTAISMLGRYKVIHKDVPCNNRLLACLCYLVLLNLSSLDYMVEFSVSECYSYRVSL